ncbi:carbohydrate ABC transporter permease [Amphibacillus sp. Q70]|uniref:carbohydrate ABC transporter permease n=1 Tax=Amphibacillus sp. Q70 TaxID=3453416 RepID=UPI003F8367A2
MQQKIIIILFSLVPILLLVTFSYLPLFNMFTYSFTSWDGLSPVKEFVGFQNYIRLFTNPEYFHVFKVSLYYLVASFVQLGIALYFATLLTFKVRFKNFFKGTLFFPYLLNGVAIGFTFLFFFRQDGTLDTLLSLIGLEDMIQMWLRDPNIINFSLASTSVWRHMGFNFIIFVGAISSISNEIYEAAEMDGANRWQQFRYIIFPSILKIIQLNLILSISGALSVFEIPYIMTGGANGSSTFVIQTVDLAFKYNNTGLASAMGIVLLIIVMIVSLIQRLAFKED